MNRKKSLLINLLVLFLCVGALAVIGVLDIAEKNMTETDFMYATVDGHKIQVHEQDGSYYLFLPGYVSEDDIKLSREAQKHDITIMKSANLATVYITTNSGSLDKVLADKEHKESGKITVVDENGIQDVSVGLDYIKGRGNYSWNTWDKKPFKIKLSKNASVLGMGRGKDYALIANASDATLIRNDIARKLEIAVGIPYATTGRFTDLYINGDYMGNYYLCASIEVGEDRINITDIEKAQSEVFSRINENAFEIYETRTMKGWNLPEVVSDITGGYLVEREFVDRYNLEYGDFNNGFVTDAEEHFIVVSPKYCTVNEINYISDFFNEAEKEILGEEPYGKYIDVSSFAKRYMVEELIKNYDGGVSSAYYFKDKDSVSDKLYAGPGWDFDMSLGNYLDWMEFAYEDATGITGLYLSEHNSIYYKNMITHEEFNSLVHEYYRDYALDYMNSLVDTGIDEYEELLGKSAQMDRIRWADMYKEWGYAAGDSSEYESLKDFISQRTAFLSGEWLE